MDAVSKRQVICALFIALQSWKLYDWLIDLPASLASPSSILLDDLLAFCFKWATLELAFLAGVHWARVPKMVWRLRTRVAVYGALCCLTLGMAVYAPAFLDELKEGSRANGILDDITGSRENIIRETSSNIAGEFTVKVKPWAVAKLNPEGKSLCLVTSTPPPNSHGLSASAKRPIVADDEPSVLIPISLSGTAPWTLSWECTSASSFGPFNFDTERHTEVFYEATPETGIRARHTGSYRLVQLLDGNGSAGKLPKEWHSFNLNSCPEARIDGITLQNGMKVCVGQKMKQSLRIWLSGQAPFALSLTHFSSLNTASEPLTRRLSFKDLRAELPAVEGLNKSGKFSLVKVDLPEFVSAGEHLLRVDTLGDADGMKRSYGEWDMGDSLLISAHAPPSASWIDSSVSRALLEGQQSLPLAVSLKGRAPFSISYEVLDSTDQMKRISSETVEDISQDTYLIEAKLAGTYHLTSLKDSLCEGSINGADEIVVSRAARPSMKATFQPIKSPCHGDLGAMWELDLAGMAPFTLTLLEQVAGGVPVKRVLKSAEHKLSHRWIPSTAGKHKLTFVKLCDALYKEDKAAELGESFEINVMPMPDARIVSPSPEKTVYYCAGREDREALEVELSLEGIGPWKLEGVLELSDKTSKSLSWSLNEARSKVSIEVPEPSGTHALKLFRVFDVNGCVRSIDTQYLTMSVLPIMPSVSFVSGRTSLSLRQDSSAPARLPLRLEGNKSPWAVDVLVDGKLRSFKVEKKDQDLDVSLPGTYELIGVRDAYCSGVVGDENKAIVTVLKAPTAVFSDSIPQQVCRASTKHQPSVIVSGSGKVSLTYKTQYGRDQKELASAKPTEHQLNVDLNEQAFATLSISFDESRQPGYYRYTLLRLSDAVYPSVDMKSAKSFTQHVLPDPSPRFPDLGNGEPALHCLTGGPLQIKVDFTGSSIKGAAPWNLEYELIKDSTPIRVDTAQVTSAGILSIQDLALAGVYHLRVIKVQDGHGCVWRASDVLSFEQALSSGHATSVQLLQPPSITRVKAGDSSVSHACMGDVARFELGGSGPWTVSYSLIRADGQVVPRSETVRTPSLTILLAEPGTIRITSVSNGRCKIDTPSALPPPIEIKRLPSANIVSGRQWVHEDESASFSVHLGGEAPFTFTYQRLDENTGVVLESQTIDGVKAHEYTVEVPGVSGTFRIESVQDRWCRFPRHSNL